jgi:DNA-binding IclR family transcriptional regulator
MSASTNASRALVTLLELGRAGVAGITLKDLAAAVGDPKPAMLRCLQALLEYGFAEQVARGRYRLGPSIYSLAKAENAVHVEVAKWRSALALLAEKLGQTMYLARRAGLDVVVIDMEIGSSPVQALSSGIGGRLPMGIGSGSLAIVSTLDPQVRSQIIATNADRYSQWKLDVATVTRYVDQAAPRDYSCDVGLIIPDVGGLAVPIRERGQYSAVMALGMTAPKSFFDTHNHGAIADEIKKVISRVQAGLPLTGDW